MHDTPAAESTILIVDDVPENLDVLRGLLEPAYRVREADSGSKALALIGEEPRPDLVLLDVMMPQMDGYEVLKRLQADPATASIPVIFLTALGMTEDETTGLQRGAVDYVSKPVWPDLLLARVRTHVELKKARDRLADDNAYLEAEVRRRMAENQLIQDVSILALAELAEIRDNETGNHLRRTQGYIQALGRRLSTHPRFSSTLTPAYRELLVKSAPLHDIGKVGIPDHILLKPGKLTPQEWTIMKTHAALGSDALEEAERGVEQPLAFLRLAKEIARHHHERWDGSGYPDALAGDAIPVSARLMAIADVFDALISARPYKAAMTLEQARAIMAELRGTQFDPDIFDAFIELQDEFAQIAHQYRDEGLPPPPADARA